jgi:hypothetical protein
VVSGQISPVVAAALLSKPRPLLTGWQAAKVEALKRACRDFARMRSLVMSFRGILQAGKVATLERWMKKADGSGIYGMKRFVRKLNHDLAAVKNALRESWKETSNPHKPFSPEHFSVIRHSSTTARAINRIVKEGIMRSPTCRSLQHIIAFADS